MDDLIKALGINTNGVKYDDLSAEEHQTLTAMLQNVQKQELSIDRIKSYIHQMRDIVEQKLTEPNLSEREDIYLKARLKNYMLLESFLMSPERAKAALERSLQKLK